MSETKIIQVFIPYERPGDIIAQEIFGIELTVHILFNHSGDGCRLKIKYDGTVEYQRTNIYAEFLE